MNQRCISSVLRAGYLRWLLLLALGWSQLLVAAHEHEHSMTDLESSCAVCALLDRDEDGAAAPDAVVPRALPAPIEIAAVASPADVDVFTHYRSRASP